MDYVLIVAILTFFILFYALNRREGYTDTNINNTIEEINRVKENVNKTLTNVKDLTGTNTGTTTTIDVMTSIEQLQTGIDSKPYENLDSYTLTYIKNQKERLLVIQNNIVSIRKKIKDVIDSTNVTVIPLDSSTQQSLSFVEAIKIIKDELNIITDSLNKIPDKAPN